MYPKISNAQKLNFLNGLFSASVPVGLAYAGDVNETKREKDSEIGMLVGISMLVVLLPFLWRVRACLL